MHQQLLETIALLNQPIAEERIEILRILGDYIINKKKREETIQLNFICTHNSRRSHLAQIWAQALAHYFKIDEVHCFSGGTEATAMYGKVADTLINQGFAIEQLSKENNPVYAIKYAVNENAVICFSKKFNHGFNPQSDFCAILTCNSADEACPIVTGAEKRIALTYDDPKAFDKSDLQAQKYAERSLEIANELYWVFKYVKDVFVG
jgi:arsenate reductase (thioredoxin)